MILLGETLILNLNVSLFINFRMYLSDVDASATFLLK